jgi:hypothetical protein
MGNAGGSGQAVLRFQALTGTERNQQKRELHAAFHWNF